MMGTLATVLAGRKIFTREDRYRAEVQGDVENVDGVLKITTIRVDYHLKVPEEQAADARDAFSSYLHLCPAAQSVIGCIALKDRLLIEEIG
jgi:organic hydroperoxide reductase OsmC/OhrA